MPGVTVADVARRHGTTRWQVYDWRRKLRAGQLRVPESVAGLPTFAELVVEDPAEEAPASQTAPALEIGVGDVVIRASTDADEELLTRTNRAARASTP